MRLFENHTEIQNQKIGCKKKLDIIQIVEYSLISLIINVSVWAGQTLDIPSDPPRPLPLPGKTLPISDAVLKLDPPTII